MSAEVADLFAAKDQPLREDVRELGALLGEVLKEQGPEGLFERVESVRKSARRRRDGDGAAEAELARLLRGLKAEQALPLVRAFSSYFFMVNMAERIHRIRRAIDYRRENRAQPGSWDAVVASLVAQKLSAPQLQALLERMVIAPVFTAHPTEATRRSLLVKEQRIARALMDRLSVENDPRAIRARVRNEITTIWQTEEQLSVRPSVADEVEHILFYLSEVIYRVVPRCYADLSSALARHAGAPVAVPPFLHFASWVGGDMDGNPNVGPDTIRATLARHHEMALKKYREEVRELFGYLTQTRSLIDVSPAIERRIAQYRRRLKKIHEEIPARYQDMPYRVLLWFIARRLDLSGGEGKGGYARPEEVLADLALIVDSLRRHRGGHAGVYLVERLMRRIETFGFHFATLDVRQHAAVHRRAAAAVLRCKDFAEMDRVQRTQRLQKGLSAGARAPRQPDAETARVLGVMRAVADGRARYGENALGLLIISMAQGADDALAPLLLARAAGACDAKGHAPLDVAPLFETLDDLTHARRSLEALWANPVYRRHLRRRGGTQYVMLGYSDSNKDAGIAAARWALYNAQIEIVAAARAAGLTVTLFHGRGGSISRGGGKPRAAILAEPPGAVDGRLRVTEQGEIIHAKYGLRGLAIRTLELMGSAVLERLGPQSAAVTASQPWALAMRHLSEASCARYRGLVYEDAGFHDYFRSATPIDVIERMLIGSRPARRSGQAGIADLRAIPWVFAWTQSRHILPGWFGVGSGLEHAERQAGLGTLQQMARDWPFFDNLLSDAEMALAKSELDIARRYAELAGAEGARIFGQIEAEAQRTRAALCRVRGAEELLSRDPVLRRALWLRNPYIDPMSFVQVDLLRRWRKGGRRDAGLERALVATVHGIARGMQNTG
jgi:phosphoenolpyruvate carboxylase